jgi:hypothetical protein
VIGQGDLFAAPAPQGGHPDRRRIDITIERLDAIAAELGAEEQERLANQKWWATVVIVARLRSMERAENEFRVGPTPMADAYDRVVQPGEHAAEALVRTFKAVYA